MKKISTAKKTARLGMLIALAFTLSYLEGLMSLNIPIPGIKLGLANIVILTMLYLLTPIEAACVSIVRIFALCITFGNLSMAAYSLAGALLSFAVMLLFRKSKKLSILGVSVLGGCAHNIGQIAVAMLMLGSPLLYYLPYLLIGGVISGIIIGLLSTVLTKALKRFV